MNVRPTSASHLAIALAIALLLPAYKRGEAMPVATYAAEPTPVSPPSPAIKPPTDAIEPTEEAVVRAKEQIKASAATVRAQWRGKTFEEFEASVFKEPGKNGKYIIDGDTAIPDRKLLQEYFEKLQDDGPGSTTHRPLIVHQIGSENRKILLSVNLINGRPDILNSGNKNELKYCINTAFGAGHPAVVADMAAATHAWEEAANVNFLYVPAEDGNCTASNQNVVFDVRPVDVDGKYLARAFFPNDQREARNVLIDESAFDLEPGEALQLLGILRHELGHTLGWRHEHTRPESGTCFEDNEFQPLTSYDRFSVMHYPQCNGGGDWSLQLTASDKVGSACIYGKGSSNAENLSQCLFKMPEVVTGSEGSETFDNQTVAKSEMNHYGPFPVKPGSLVAIRLSGTGISPSDPDLYVDFARKPELNRWICRPFLSHANEICELQVPSDRHNAYVMVRGYTAGTYQLNITYVRP